jgi:hypothetical protein
VVAEAVVRRLVVQRPEQRLVVAVVAQPADAAVVSVWAIPMASLAPAPV